MHLVKRVVAIIGTTRVTFLAMTMNNRFSVIHQCFPVRRFDRIYAPSPYEDFNKTAKKFLPIYEVKYIKNEDILNIHEWWPKYLKKNHKGYKTKE